MSYFYWTLLAIATGVLLFIRSWYHKYIHFWQRHGFLSVGSEVVGSWFTIVFKRLLIFETDAKIYQHLKSDPKRPSYVGFIEFAQHGLFITDLDLARHIFVKDFDSFTNRRQLAAMEETDPMFFKMLFFMEGEPWRELRNKMSPTFTTGKIRRMFEIFTTSSGKLVGHLGKCAAAAGKGQEGGGGGVVDFVDAYGRYTMDVIASAAFGVDSRTFLEDNPIFQAMGKKLQIEINPKIMVTLILMTAAPKLAAALGLGFTDKKAENFFTEVILSAIKHREKSGEKRDDFLQLMLEARNGQLKAVDEAELSTFEKEGGFKSTSSRGGATTDKVALTDDVIVAQSVLFILAGFDTTQSLLLFAVYELACNPEVQEKLAEEIEASMAANGGKFTYESINHLEYLDKVTNETLRKYPPVPRLERRTAADYKLPDDSGLTIPKDVLIAIPTYSIHHDEEYFPNPSRFDPERFINESKATRHPYAFQPFGHGPRNCIGMRFALTNSKMAIANIVRHFVLEPCQETIIPMKFLKTSSLKPESMFLKLRPRRGK